MSRYFHKLSSQMILQQTLGRGVLKFGFGRDVPLRNLKVDPYKYRFFSRKSDIHVPIGPILGPILSQVIDTPSADR